MAIKKSLVLAAFVVAVLPAAAQVQARRLAITPEDVARALTDSGWKVSADRIKLLAPVTATYAAQLDVMQVTHWQAGKLRAKLHCRDPRACLPFFVLIDEAEKDALSHAAIAEASEPPANLLAEPEAPLLRSGDPATLKFADRGLSITMPVICLENGRRGQKIRVASMDHKRFYKAEIVGPGLLKATTL